jgi:hypothetical protein
MPSKDPPRRASWPSSGGATPYLDACLHALLEGEENPRLRKFFARLLESKERAAFCSADEEAAPAAAARRRDSA